MIPVRELGERFGASPDEAEHMVREQFRSHRATLQDDRSRLLERFQVIDVARKAVGLGSVGTRAFIVPRQGRDESTRCSCRPRSQGLGAGGRSAQESLPEPGERVAQGQRTMQASSDIYLGWTKSVQDYRFFRLARAARHEGLCAESRR